MLRHSCDVVVTILLVFRRGSIRVSADVIVDIRNTTQEQIAESFMNDTNVLQLDIGDNPTAIGKLTHWPRFEWNFDV